MNETSIVASRNTAALSSNHTSSYQNTSNVNWYTPENNLGYGVGRFLRYTFNQGYHAWINWWQPKPSPEQIALRRREKIYKQALEKCVVHFDQALENLRKNPNDPQAFKKIENLASRHSAYITPASEEKLNAYQQKLFQPLSEKVSKLFQPSLVKMLQKLLPTLNKDVEVHTENGVLISHTETSSQNNAKLLMPLLVLAHPEFARTPLGALSMVMAMAPTAEANIFKSVGSAFNRATKGAGLLGNALKKVFSPGDYLFPTDSIEAILEKADKVGKGLVWEAGKEVRVTVGKAGEELRTTIKTAEDSGHKLIADFGEKGKLLIEKAGNEFRVTADQVLKKAFDGAEATIKLAGEEVRMTVAAVGNEARLTIKEAGVEARVTIQALGQEFTGVIEKGKEAGNELILNMGNQGKLFIEKVGTEFRFSADEVMKKAFKGAEITLEVAGLQTRLAIQEAGVELRSVITHAGNEIRAISYEIPRLSRLAAESFVAGLATELETILLGKTEVKEILYKMKNYLRENREPRLETLLEFVEEQNADQLSPQDKAQLYISLIKWANDPNLPIEARHKITLIIGATALNDTRLFELVDWQITSYIKDYTIPILEAIPNTEVKTILATRDEKAFLSYFGLIAAPQESDGSVPIGSVVSFPGHILPADFVECDGREFAVEDFPELYGVTGKRYGYRKDESGREYFKIPDYRGYFLRGWDHEEAINSEKQELGAVQQDSTRLPNAEFQVNTAGEHSHKMGMAGDHEHVIENSGEHNHQMSTSGDHKHTVEKSGNHIHTVESSGGHKHIIEPDGQHSHGMDTAGGHTHDSHFASTPHGKVSFAGVGIGQPGWHTYPVADCTQGHIQTTCSSGRHQHTIKNDGTHAHVMKGESGQHIHKINSDGIHTHTMEEKGAHTHEISTSETHTHPVQTSGSHHHEITIAGEHSHTLTGGDKETRPKNVNAKFMIKYKSSTKNLHEEIKELKEELSKTREEIVEKYQTGLMFFTAVTTVAAVGTVAIARCGANNAPQALGRR